jgi:DNA-binding response OmpR family regulator
MAMIVLADDDDDLRALYAAALRTDGHEVVEACDGREAVELTRARRPELLLLDIWMPALNGFEVLDALRHDGAGVRLRVVVVSNLADAEARLEAFEAGASDYLVKGGPLAEFLGQVRAALDGADALTPD